MKPKNIKTTTVIAQRNDGLNILLFKALKHAEDGNVLFIMKDEIRELPPDTLSKMCKYLMKRITFAYPKTFEEICDLCSTVHTWRNTPDTIIVESLEKYFDFDNDYSLSKAALLCALLLDTASSCAKDSQCNLTISVEEAVQNQEMLTTLMELYFYDDAE